MNIQKVAFARTKKDYLANGYEFGININWGQVIIDSTGKVVRKLYHYENMTAHFSIELNIDNAKKSE